MILTDLTLHNYKQINVIGSPGSGKSTLSEALSKLLSINVYDLDDFLYDNKCKRLNTELTKKAILKLLQNEKFIIDGTYTTTFFDRLNYLDLVIILDTSTIISLINFFKRYFFRKNLKCGEKITWKTLCLILKFNRETKPLLMKKIIDAGVKCAFYNRNNCELKWLN